MSFYLFRHYFLSARSGSFIKFVSWICIAGMAVSLSALILVISVMEGLGQSIKNRLLSKEAHLILEFQKNPFLNKKTAIDKTTLFSSKEKPDFLFSHLNKKQREGIKNILLYEKQDLILKNEENSFQGISAFGYSKKQWKNLFLKNREKLFNKPIESSNWTPVLKKPDTEILLSQELFLQRNFYEESELLITPLSGLLLPPNLIPPVKKIKIKGFLQNFSKGEKAFAIYYKQGEVNFGDFSRIQYGAEINLYNSKDVEIYKRLLKKYHPESWKERNSNLFFALKMEKMIMFLLLIIAFIISSLGISSAMLLLITQKGKDIAILRAMGMSQKELIKNFTRIGLYLSLIALGIGFCMGLGGTLFLKYNDSINFLNETYKDRTIPAVFAPVQYLIILSGSFLISWLSCYLPTKYLSQIHPADFLKVTRF